MTSQVQDPFAVLEAAIDRARRAGADAADAVWVSATAVSARLRMREPEAMERAEGHDLGLRVFLGRRMAIAATSDLAPSALDALAERAVAMARAVPEDPYCGLADPAQLVTEVADLDLADPKEPSADTLAAMARAAEEAALAVEGVTNSEGAEASFSRHEVAIAATNGFSGRYAGTGSGLSASVIAGTGTAMETDFAHTGAVYRSDLRSAEAVGREAGERAVRRLGARKVPTVRVPVVFDPRVARSLLSHLTGAIAGPAIARGTSFLKDRLGQPVFAAGLRVIDDPTRRRGLRSKPFDGEGVANRRRAIVDDGVLTTWLLDLRSARQLGLETTGHASRSVGGQPSPSATNLYLEAGSVSPADMIAAIDQGFYVTQLMGQGVNGVTGDYSRGATGFWIERGALAYPVSEVTIAGNLKDMYRAMTPADDLVFERGVDSPTVRVDGMTVAGR